jgi:hypothetical protein
MVKMKVVKLFKTYNFALELKLKNLKYTVLFHHFTFKSNFTKICPNKANFITFWAYLQAFNADHDDIHFFTLTLGNFWKVTLCPN